MPALPIYCELCEEWFLSGMFMNPGTTQSFRLTSECHVCGTMASLPRGTYTALEREIQVSVHDNDATIKLQRLISLLEGARTNDLSGAEIADRIAKQVPVSSDVLAVLSSARGMAVMTLLSLLIAALTLTLDRISGDDKLSERDIAEIVSRVLAADRQLHPDHAPPDVDASRKGTPRSTPDLKREARDAAAAERLRRAGERYKEKVRRRSQEANRAANRRRHGR